VFEGVGARRWGQPAAGVRRPGLQCKDLSHYAIVADPREESDSNALVRRVAAREPCADCGISSRIFGGLTCRAAVGTGPAL